MNYIRSLSVHFIFRKLIFKLQSELLSLRLATVAHDIDVVSEHPHSARSVLALLYS